MAKAWYEYPVTHGYITSYQGPNTDTPHYAEDIGTPFHTPLTAILPGIVETANYQAWGGQIFIKPDNPNFPEYYYYHPDEIDVHVGEHVAAGQEIGLSGGENPGFPGAEHPAQPQFSSGPHTHVGWFDKYVSTPIGQEPFGPDPSNLLAMAQGGSNVSTVPSAILSAVQPIARQDNVPDALWETVADVESGFNPNALGDQGTSFGLFQLHIGGQFPSQYLSDPTALDDPGLNAQFALPDIAKAWHDLSASFDPNSSAWWEQFAAQSGHPGGSPGEAVTDNEAAKLQQAYASFASGSSPSGPGPFGVPDAFALPSPGDVANGITSWISGNASGFLMRVGVGLAGIVAIFLGGYEITQAFNGNTVSHAQNDQSNEEDETAEDRETDARHRREDRETERENLKRDAEQRKLQAKANREGART